MSDRKSDDLPVKKVSMMEGHVDLTFDAINAKASIGIVAKNGTPYVEAEFNGSSNIDELIEKLRWLKRELLKTEQ